MRPDAILLLAAAMAVAGCSRTGTPPADRLPVEVEEIRLSQRETYPVQLALHVEGWLPNPCTTLDWEVPEPAGGDIDVALFSVADGSEACIQVLAPFTVDIPLGSPPADTHILLNGEPVE